MHTPSRTELPLTASSSGCGCSSTDAGPTPPTDTGVEYGVEGLTCGGCMANVQRAIKAIDGVNAAAVELVPSGVSRLIVTGSAGPSVVRQAVRSAGYSLASS